jgi:hypothetical protein
MMFNAIQNPTKKCSKIKFTSSSSITSRNDLSSTLCASKWVCSRSQLDLAHLTSGQWEL